MATASSSVTHLTSAAAVKAWLDEVDTLLLDCDGVLWRGSSPIANAAAAVSALHAVGKRTFYVSNNATKSRSDYIRKLSDVCGITAVESEVISSAFVAATYLSQRFPPPSRSDSSPARRTVYVIGQSGLVDELTAAGFAVLGPGDFDAPFSFGSMMPSDLDPAVCAVVVGFDSRLSYAKIARACSYLRYAPHTLFVATNRDSTFPDEHMIVPGGGVCVAAVECGSGRAPDVIAGKPAHTMLDVLAGAEGFNRSRACMVGDRLDTDILFGNSGSLRSTLLVRTGVSTLAQVEAKLAAGDDASRAHAPTHTIESIGDLAPLIREAYGLQ